MNEDEQLQQEISLLERNIVDIQEDLELLSKNESILQQEVTSLKQIQEEQNRQPADDHHEEVPIIKHTYFDPSIAQFFEDTEGSTQIELINEQIIEKADTKENIMYENILRMGGITAFPISKHVFPNDEVLGIRFDIFSTKSRSYKQPHYAILLKGRYKSEALHWRIHKTTLPAHVPLDRYQQELQETNDLDKFVNQIYMYLAKDNEKREVDS